MKITFNDEHKNVQQAVQMANLVLANDDFYARIRQVTKFDLSTAAPAIIADLIKNSRLDFKVELFYPSGWRAIKYRKTFAYTDEIYLNTLFLNLRKLDREIEDIAATIIHESIHALDDECLEYTFGHGNNSSKGKDNTAPYWIGNLAYQILKGDIKSKKLTFDQEENN
jgi:hypothetical protein